jgi:hypothetical protein
MINSFSVIGGAATDTSEHSHDNAQNVLIIWVWESGFDPEESTK